MKREMLITVLTLGTSLTSCKPRHASEASEKSVKNWEPTSEELGREILSCRPMEPIELFSGFELNSIGFHGQIDDVAKLKPIAALLSLSVRGVDRFKYSKGTCEMKYMSADSGKNLNVYECKKTVDGEQTLDRLTLKPAKSKDEPGRYSGTFEHLGKKIRINCRPAGGSAGDDSWIHDEGGSTVPLDPN